jgi:hypothetical protein
VGAKNLRRDSEADGYLKSINKILGGKFLHLSGDIFQLSCFEQ